MIRLGTLPIHIISEESETEIGSQFVKKQELQNAAAEKARTKMRIWIFQLGPMKGDLSVGCRSQIFALGANLICIKERLCSQQCLARDSSQVFDDQNIPMGWNIQTNFKISFFLVIL